MASALAVGMGIGVFASGPTLGDGQVRQINVQTRSVPLHRQDTSISQIGRLKYMGGVAVRSSDRQFGGLSSLLWEKECGRLLSASDSGIFVAIELEEDAEGFLTGVSAAWLSPIIMKDGKPAQVKSDADAESLSRDGDDVLVWFETAPRVQRHVGLTACKPETLGKAPREVIRYREMSRWPGNGGAEAVANIGKQQIIISEEGKIGKQGREGVVIDGKKRRRFTYLIPHDHVPTALDVLEAGDNPSFMVLHRRLGLKGLTAVVGEFSLPDENGAEVTPKVIARFEPPYTVDNMEGLAVRTEGDRQFIYLVSDDNFFALQRTLLLKFELMPDEVKE